MPAPRPGRSSAWRAWPRSAASAFRPAQGARTPPLADTPEELTAANGAASTLESLSFFVGPALGAFLLSDRRRGDRVHAERRDVPVVAALVAGIRVAAGSGRRGSRRDAAARDEDESTRARGSCGRRGRVRRDHARQGHPDGRHLLCAQTVVAGASAVFGVVMAVEILHTGSRASATSTRRSAWGRSSAGSSRSRRARKRKLAPDIALGVVLWSFPWSLRLGLADPGGGLRRDAS